MTQGAPAPRRDDETIRLLMASARMYPRRIDPLDRVEFVHMTPDGFRDSAFLDHRTLTVGGTPVWVPLDELMALADSGAGAEARPEPCRRYLFHIGHVGSTLISRLLGSLEGVLALREPLLLNWLALLKIDLGRPESRVSEARYATLLGLVLALLSKTFTAEDRVVIKPTSYTNILAADILGRVPSARAGAIFTPLRPFMATILKGAGGLSDVMTRAPLRIRRLNRLLEGEAIGLAGMDPGEIVAMTWVTEMLTLDAAAESRGGAVTWFDFERYLLDPAASLESLLHHLEIAPGEGGIEALASSPLHGMNAKNPQQAYGAGNRREDIARVLASSGEDITAGERWFEAQATAHPAIARLAKLAATGTAPA